MNQKNSKTPIKVCNSGSNATKRKAKHELNELLKSERKLELHTLVKNTIEQYGMDDQGVYLLKRICGTLNITRVTQFSNGSAEFQTWFKNKNGNKVITELAKNTKIPARLIPTIRDCSKTCTCVTHCGKSK